MENIEIKTLQSGIPTPNDPAEINNYIRINGIWYKQVKDVEELKMLEGKKNNKWKKSKQINYLNN